MKCIYCNAETELTLSDIITYAITGAKVAKTFVCQVHNAFTNKMYEIIRIQFLGILMMV